MDESTHGDEARGAARLKRVGRTPEHKGWRQWRPDTRPTKHRPHAARASTPWMPTPLLEDPHIATLPSLPSAPKATGKTGQQLEPCHCLNARASTGAVDGAELLRARGRLDRGRGWRIQTCAFPLMPRWTQLGGPPMAECRTRCRHQPWKGSVHVLCSGSRLPLGIATRSITRRQPISARTSFLAPPTGASPASAKVASKSLPRPRRMASCSTKPFGPLLARKHRPGTALGTRHRTYSSLPHASLRTRSTLQSNSVETADNLGTRWANSGPEWVEHATFRLLSTFFLDTPVRARDITT